VLLEHFQLVFHRPHRTAPPVGGEEDSFLFRFPLLVGFTLRQFYHQPIVVKAQVREV
jgi:hypothetical protein